MNEILTNKEKKSRPVAAGGSSSPRSSVVSSLGGCVNSRLDYTSNADVCEDVTGIVYDIESPILEELNEELRDKFTDKKNRSLRLAQVYQNLGMDSRSSRVAECATFLEFGLTPSGAKLHQANFCRDRFCPQCNWRRSLKIFGQVSSCMDYLEPAGYRYLFLTLTIRNCTGSDFPSTVQQMFEGWRWLQHKSKRFKRSVLGSFRSFEVTYNKQDGSFHPHFHIILAVPPAYFSRKTGLYISQQEWSKLWRQACGLDYDPIVFIRNVYQRQDEKTGDEQSVAGAIAEVSKYATKSEDYLTGADGVDERVLSVYLAGLTGRRLCSFTGCFSQARKSLALDDAENGDLIHTDPHELRDDIQTVIIRFHWSAGAYFIGSMDRSKGVVQRVC